MQHGHFTTIYISSRKARRGVAGNGEMRGEMHHLLWFTCPSATENDLEPTAAGGQKKTAVHVRLCW